MITCSEFKPAWWLRNRHWQTTWPALFRRVENLKITRERMPTADGDFVDLDWCGGPSGPLIIVLHGLAGSSRSIYVQGIQQALCHNGFRSVALNFRGCSGYPNKKARAYHSGETGDLNHLYVELRKREAEIPVAAVGYSLGGNVLLKWLGEKGNGPCLFAAVAVSVPFELGLCADRMDIGLSRIYRNLLIGSLKNELRKKLEYFDQTGISEEAEKLRAIGDLKSIRSFWEFDDRVVAALFSFKDVHDYYMKSSSGQFLRFIKVSTLLLQSLDDPFMPPDALPSQAMLSPAISLEISGTGGHVGFVCAENFRKPNYWLDQRIVEFLQDRLITTGKHVKET